MTAGIMNARMYAVTAEVEAGWRALLKHISHDAGVALTYMRYPAPKPLEDLWSRADLGCVLMCGYPIALQLAPVIPIAAPIPRAAWAGKLKVVVDLNALPPLGVEGVEVNDDGETREGAIAFGALGVGNFKMKLHKECIARLFTRSDLVLDAETIEDVAKELMK